MNIRTRLSPNIDDRKLPISTLVLHYTGMENGEVALQRLTDPLAKVSAHYVVEEDGAVWQLVDEDMRAWHAGVSFWNGITDVNSASIGIEIVNGGHDHGLPDFPDVQIKSVIALCQSILTRHEIAPMDIVAHSDIAPARKMDPGEKFPWARLAADGIAIYPDRSDKDRFSDDLRVLFSPGTRDRGVAIVQRGLNHIGYGSEVTGVMDEDMCLTIAALQRRYRPEVIDGIIDVQTMEIISWLAEQRSLASQSQVIA